MILLGNRLKKNKKVSVEQSINQNEIISDDDEPLSENEKEGSGKFLKNYWLFLSIKQHIINYFSEITCCKITISYVPLELRFVRSIFLFILSIVITILWLDQKYFEKNGNILMINILYLAHSKKISRFPLLKEFHTHW